MQAVWLGETRNDNEMRYELFLHATNYMNECEEKYLRPIVNRVYDSSWDMFDRHTYPGKFRFVTNV
jgi:aminopeptidase N